MVIDVYTSEPHRHTPRFTADALTLKLCMAILLLGGFFASSAFLRNGQRTLSEEISRLEAQKTELLKELTAQRGNWSRCSNAVAIADKLRERGYSVGNLAENQTVRVFPNHGQAPADGIVMKAPSAVASR